jgi:serine/threonine protein kinase
MANKIGRFEILSEITHSAIGHVYKASDPENGQTVALKTLQLSAIGEHVNEMVQRLVQESQGTGSLSSHNIAQLHGVDEIDGQFCAAMEYVQGNSISTMLARNEGFSIWDVKDIMRQACQALDHAHSRNVFHYSLEPDKIMSQWDGMAKILGFGVSGMSIPSVQLHGKVPQIMHYMSPEQFLGHAVDARSNLFSLGAILYEMLTEQRAFDGEDEEQIKQQILEGTPVPPHQINNKISLDISAVIMKALAKDPGQRFQVGQELVTALEGHKQETVVGSAAKKSAQPAKGISAPQKSKPASRVAATQAPSEVSAPPQPASAQSGPQNSAAKSVAAAAGWGGTGAGSPAAEAPRTPSLDPTEQFITSCVKASIEAANGSAPVMSAPPAEEADTQTLGFKVDPMMAEPKRGGPASRSFSELDELPPLKEVYVAPPLPPPTEPEAPVLPEPVLPRMRTPAREERPKIQPRVVAKKAVQEIQKTPPKLFGYSMAGAGIIILLVIAGITWHIHSENSEDVGTPTPAVSQVAPAEPTPPAVTTPTPVPARIAPERVQPPEITVRSKPAPKKTKTTAAVLIPGEVAVSSTPAGAQILIDGQSDPSWVTPSDVTGITPGHHTITVSKAGYVPESRTLEVASRSKTVLVLDLALMGASLSVASQPAGAKVFVDGKDMGRLTPVQVSVDKPGNHTILVRKDGYLDESMAMNLQAGQTSHYAPTLRRLGMTADIKIKRFLGGGAPEGTGMVSIKTQPKGAQITVNRRVLDKASPVEFYLNPGTYVIDINASGYKSLQRVINVETGGKVAIDESLPHE